MSLILQATQPAASDWLSPDKIAALIVAITGLVTAIVALMRASANKGALEQVTSRQDAQSENTRQMRGDITQVRSDVTGIALHVKPPGDGGKPPEAEPFSGVPRGPQSLSGLVNPYPQYPSDRPKP